MEQRHERRKFDHLRIALEEEVGFPRLTTGLERFRFLHQALPEIDLEEVDCSVDLFGKKLRYPLLISSMTGGTARAETVNLRLAEAAQAKGVAMGIGSQRAAVEDTALEYTYQVRRIAPDILLMANLGAVQLNYGYGIEQAKRAVEMIEADALILHLNPLQEALQPDGDWNWAGVLARIEEICRKIEVPVVVKEVGWGISGKVAKWLAEAGVSAIDVAGAGGTSWSQVERFRAPDNHWERLAAAFEDWGIPTAESLLMVREATPEIPVIASGGIRNGIDVAKALALGATMAGMASPFLKAASESAEAVAEEIELISQQLRIACFASGARNVAQLREPGRLVRI
jgi:isopentenyl-diphosphate delta-isomerase